MTAAASAKISEWAREIKKWKNEKKEDKEKIK